MRKQFKSCKNWRNIVVKYKEGDIFTLPRQVSDTRWMPLWVARIFGLTHIEHSPNLVTKVTESLIYYRPMES